MAPGMSVPVAPSTRTHWNVKPNGNAGRTSSSMMVPMVAMRLSPACGTPVMPGFPAPLGLTVPLISTRRATALGFTSQVPSVLILKCRLSFSFHPATALVSEFEAVVPTR